MKRYLKMLATFIVLVLALSACTAGLPAETAHAPTEAPTTSPVPATATPVSTPESSEAPAETADAAWAREIVQRIQSPEEKVYSIEDFFDLPVGRSTHLDAVEKGVYSNSGQFGAVHPAGSFTYYTADPEITIHLAPEKEYDALYYLAYTHIGFEESSMEESLAGTFVDEHALGIHEIAEAESENIPLDPTYTLQDFAWIELGKTTFEEVCKYTAAEDYFYFDADRKVLCYPSAVPGANFFILSNAEGLVYRVVNIWDPENDPEVKAFFTEDVLAEQQRKKDLILEEYMKVRNSQ